jgi:2,3-bisphosphoglycerate-dependent phosphoglycerate mutase
MSNSTAHRTLILIRHGQSLWNLENRFTGWVDVPLTAKGEGEARAAASHLKGIRIDVAYTSALRRAQRSLELVLEEHAKSQPGVVIPTIRDSALNERHYGDLQGMNKDDLRKKYGEEQVKLWRRSFDTPPPNGEALKNTAERTLPFYERCILGDIRQGKNVLVVAHGNSNRSIVMKLENLTGEQIVNVELETGVPLIYHLDGEGKLVKKLS